LTDFDHNDQFRYEFSSTPVPPNLATTSFFDTFAGTQAYDGIIHNYTNLIIFILFLSNIPKEYGQKGYDLQTFTTDIIDPYYPAGTNFEIIKKQSINITRNFVFYPQVEEKALPKKVRYNILKLKKIRCWMFIKRSFLGTFKKYVR